MSPQSELAPKLPSLDETIKRAQDVLRAQQTPAGYWWYTLQANETIGSGIIMLQHFLGERNSVLEAGLCCRLIDEQQTDGSWTIYHGGPGDLSATVEAYLALRLAAYDIDEEPLVRARQFINEHGGLTQVRIFTRIHLALFGIVPWSACPEMPAWLIFLPVKTGFSIYEFSSWARASIVPLLLVMAKKPVCPLPFKLEELSRGPLSDYDWKLETDQRGLSWENFFIQADRILKVTEHFPWHPGKEQALAACEKWTREHLERTEDIYPALAYGIMGLAAMGYNTEDPHIAKALKALQRFQQVYSGELPAECDAIAITHPLEDPYHHVSKLAQPKRMNMQDARIHQQCCISPIWDTPWAATALLASATPPDDPALQKATRYLISKQITELRGDWAKKRPEAPAGGWAFEFENDYFPDVDDTIQILHVLNQVDLPSAEKQAAIDRGLQWTLAMQCKNGGWAAFDVESTANWVNHIPFSDHGACQDPPTADITGRMIGLLADLGYSLENPIVSKAIRFVEETQETSGCWWGRWGVNYIYGSWCVLDGLSKFGYDRLHPMIARAVGWLKKVQCQDGAWGESCRGYDVGHFVPLAQGVPSQTAWALLALIAVGEAESEAVRRGIDFLQSRQNLDGTWDEAEHTGTGFPGHFYLRYHGYRHYFPLLALGRYRGAIEHV